MFTCFWRTMLNPSLGVADKFLWWLTVYVTAVVALCDNAVRVITLGIVMPNWWTPAFCALTGLQLRCRHRRAARAAAEFRSSAASDD